MSKVKKEVKKDLNCECNCETQQSCDCKPPCECNGGSNYAQILKEKDDKYLRLQAEFINFQNRTSKEVSEMIKYEGTEFIKNLLPVIDNFERAIKMDDRDLSDEVSKFLEGFKIIYGNVNALLTQFEIKEINALGEEFNPVNMDAMITEHDETKPANVVLEVYTKGYTYKDKVIRPALVKVNN